MSFPRKRESSYIRWLWMPAFAGMTCSGTFYETINCLLFSIKTVDSRFYPESPRILAALWLNLFLKSKTDVFAEKYFSSFLIAFEKHAKSSGTFLKYFAHSKFLRRNASGTEKKAQDLISYVRIVKSSKSRYEIIVKSSLSGNTEISGLLVLSVGIELLSVIRLSVSNHDRGRPVFTFSGCGYG